MANNFATAPMTKTFMNLSKTQYYGGDGSGRDTYIIDNNGGTNFNYKKSDRIDF